MFSAVSNVQIACFDMMILGSGPIGSDRLHTLEVRCLSRIWKFPDDPFVKYEPSDEPWCRRLGIGYELEVETVCVVPSASISWDGESFVIKGFALAFEC